MAYRRTSYRSSARKLQISKVLPIWTTQHTDTVTMAATSIFHSAGITDLRSYWDQLRILLVWLMVIGAFAGAAAYGSLTGLLAGAVLGFAAPAVGIWLGVMLIGIAVYLAVWIATWLVIWFIAMQILHA